jgi:hypothetical protein
MDTRQDKIASELNAIRAREVPVKRIAPAPVSRVILPPATTKIGPSGAPTRLASPGWKG